MKEETPAEAQFSETISTAKEGLAQVLTNHYHILQEKLEKDISVLEKNIQKTLAETKSKEVRDGHYKTHVKTMNNIMNVSEEIETRQKKNLENLTNPKNKREKGNTAPTGATPSSPSSSCPPSEKTKRKHLKLQKRRRESPTKHPKYS